jgi:hypothetical protein
VTKDSSKFKLSIELVPEPLWGVNLRSKDALGDYRWRKLRKSLLDRQGPGCTICGDGNPARPIAHEVWDYKEDKRAGIAKLVQIDFVCIMCNSVLHFGRTRQLLREGGISLSGLQDVKEHFCRVNHCSMDDFETHVTSSDKEWQLRSAKKWSVDYGLYAPA